jgi:protein-disulfide isomerase
MKLTSRVWRSLHSSGHPRVVLDIVVTVLMGAVAAVLLWRLLVIDRIGEPPPTPPSPIEDIQDAKMSTDISSLPTRGSQEASVVFIEFADFQCPFCARYAKESFDEIDREFISTGLVQYAVRNLPLVHLHQFAVRAAQAANCAGDQGAFWEMRAHLYNNQDRFAESVWLKNDATRVDVDALQGCLDRSDLSRIQLDQGEASRLGVRSTPTFLIGRRTNAQGDVTLVTRINGALPYAAFRDALNRALKM